VWLTELIVELAGAGKRIVQAIDDLDLLGVLADRCAVFSEEHQIVRTGTPEEILADRDLLLAVNLVHHHSHPHAAGPAHHHPHEAGHHP
jgi:cobalt/nickel transport system ATP-binding protein